MLTATAVDANNSLFPLAYAVMDAENDENWLWFLQLLRPIITRYAPQFLGPNALAILSDRQKELIEGVGEHFPENAHRHCLRHLEENMYKEFKMVKLKSLHGKLLVQFPK